MSVTTGGCTPCEVCGESQSRGWHHHKPVTADEVAEVMDQAAHTGPLLVDGRLVTTAQRIATVLLERFHVTRRADQ